MSTDGAEKSPESSPHGPYLIEVESKPFMLRAGGQTIRECALTVVARVAAATRVVAVNFITV